MMEKIEKPLSINDAVVQIQHQKNMENQRGNIEGENNFFDILIRQVTSGKILPKEAIKQAEAFANHRNEA